MTRGPLGALFWCFQSAPGVQPACLVQAGGDGHSSVQKSRVDSRYQHSRPVFATCRKFADDFHKLGLPLHVLVNNAGEHLKVGLRSPHASQTTVHRVQCTAAATQLPCGRQATELSRPLQQTVVHMVPGSHQAVVGVLVTAPFITRPCKQ